ncbi:MAG: glycosyltransferase [Acidobacteriota bacterium]|nr:glycosyltransferase [Acidobacteriota bacterium]
MTERRLVAVSWSMPPALFPRSIQVARLLKGLQRIGWQSTVVTLAEYSRDQGDPVDPALSALYSPYYKTERVAARGTTEGARTAWLNWKLGNLPPVDASWAVDAAAAARRAARRDGAEVLVTFAQPWRDHFVGLALGRPRLPWVAHFSDPWVDSLYYRDMLGADRDRDVQCEAAVIKAADLVVFTNQYAADLVMRKYPAAWRSKARVVGHAADEDLIPIADRMPRFRPVGKAPLRLAYVGTLLASRRSADDLLDALARLDARIGIRGRVELVLIGSGSGVVEARQKVIDLGVESIVSFQPQVMYLESLAAMRDSAVLVLIDARARTNVFVPSKLVDYLMAERPILGISPAVGGSADLLRSSGYPLVEPGDVEGIAGAIQVLLDRHESGARPLTAPADVVRRYSLETVAAAFAAVLEEAIAGFSWSRRWL